MAEKQFLANSLRGYRGHLANKIAAAERLLTLCPRQAATDSLKESLAESLNQTKIYMGKVEVAAQKCIEEEETDEAAEKFIKILKEDSDRTTEVRAKLQTALGETEVELTPRRPPPPVNRGENKTKANETLKPKILNRDAKPVEVTQWEKQFIAYYTSSKMNLSTLDEQRAYFYICLDPYLQTRVQAKAQGATPVMKAPGENSCMDILEEEFMLKYPIFARRLDFFRYNQKPNQAFSEFTQELRKKGDEARLAELNVDEIYVLRYLTGCCDEKLTERLLKEEEKTRDKLDKITHQYEVSKSYLKAMNTGAPIVAQVRRNDYQKKGGKSGFKKRYPKNSNGNYKKGRKFEKRDHKKNICFGCGNKMPKGGWKEHKCPAKNTTCRGCKKKGHWVEMCRQKNRARVNQTVEGNNSENESDGSAEETDYGETSEEETSVDSDGSNSDSEGAVVNSVKVNAVTTNAALNPPRNIPQNTPIPHMYVDIIKDRKTRANISCLPDTGTCRTIINSKILKQHNIRINKKGIEPISAANGSSLTCTGNAIFQIKFQGHKIWIDALAVDNLHEEMLLSMNDLKRLGIISPLFPSIMTRSKVNAISKKINAEKEIGKLTERYKDVFIEDSVTPIKGEPATIVLNKKDPTYKPLKITTARQIPLHYQAAAEKTINLFVKSGVIEKVPEQEVSEWTSPAFFVPKPNKDVRLVVDYKQLNKYIDRPVHPFPSPRDIIRSIKPTSNYFLKFDATQGYYQIPLTKEASKLTTFLLPSGRYRFTRAPMGASNSSDSFCARTDKILENIPDLLKIVDDGLIQGETEEEVISKFEKVLKACQAANLTLAKKKLRFGEKVEFAGYTISKEGVLPNADKVASLKKFPRPTDLTSLRSFLGLANQLAFFIPDYAHMTAPLRTLLKKDIAFQWQQEHEEAFQAAIKLLTSEMIVKPFDPSMTSELLTDASRLKGLGYALLQRSKNDPEAAPRLIQCGSRSLTDTESRYAANELECLAMQWAIYDCRHYLLGCKFNVITDHRPLVGTFSKPLNEITNSRLLRLREKLINYNFIVHWTPGKTHLIADALSRAPAFAPKEKETLSEEEKKGEVYVNQTAKDPILQELYDAAEKDEDYQAIINALLKGKTPTQLPPSHPARQFANVWEDLSVHDSLLTLEGNRIVIPKGKREMILELLHKPHAGIQRTRALARQHYYWPQMNHAIKQLIQLCDPCQTLRQSNKTEPLQNYAKTTTPMESISIDLFEDQNQKYLCAVDRYSGYPFCYKLKSNQLTTEAITNILHKLFQEYGYPTTTVTDNGPQFRETYDKWCRQHHITPIKSSPEMSNSNGKAEAAVKNCEYLLRKVKHNFEEFKKRLLFWKNTPSSNSDSSPAQKFFGRELRSELPILTNAKMELVSEEKKKGTLPDYKKGDRVRIQNKDKYWQEKGTIKRVRASGRSYEVEKDDGRTLVRNRKFLRKLYERDRPTPHNEETGTPPKQYKASSNFVQKVSPRVRIK